MTKNVRENKRKVRKTSSDTRKFTTFRSMLQALRTFALLTTRVKRNILLLEERIRILCLLTVLPNHLSAIQDYLLNPDDNVTIDSSSWAVEDNCF